MEGVPDAIHILIGADYDNEILIEKQHGGETAWRSQLGWVMSGPGTEAKKANGTQVGSVQTDIDFLWRLEEPSKLASTLPTFPFRKKGSTYEVGLLWKSDERPEDNRAQAMAAASNLVRKLEASGRRLQYDDVLIKEYSELEAMERQPAPKPEGLYERLVAVVKTPLQRVLGRVLVSRDELATLLAEVQFIVNERPLTHVGGLDDLPPLTPNMMTGLHVKDDGNEEEMADDHLVMNKCIKYLSQLKRNVEARWGQEYLLLLKSFHENHSHSLGVGDVVLVVLVSCTVECHLSGRHLSEHVGYPTVGSTI